MLSSGQEFNKKFLDSKHVLKVCFKPSMKNKDLYFYQLLFCLAGSKLEILNECTYDTQGDLTQIFPTFSNPILNLNFYISADPKSAYVSNIQQNSMYRIMYQSQILPPGPHFIITLIYMANFRLKKIL